MREEVAVKLAKWTNGEAIHSGGGIWLVLWRTEDGFTVMGTADGVGFDHYGDGKTIEDNFGEEADEMFDVGKGFWKIK